MLKRFKRNKNSFCDILLCYRAGIAKKTYCRSSVGKFKYIGLNFRKNFAYSVPLYAMSPLVG